MTTPSTSIADLFVAGIAALIVCGGLCAGWILLESYTWDRRRQHYVTLITRPPITGVVSQPSNVQTIKGESLWRNKMSKVPVPDAQEGIEPSYVGPTAKAVLGEPSTQPPIEPQPAVAESQLDPAEPPATPLEPTVATEPPTAS
jgi:hypothetical protein